MYYRIAEFAKLANVTVRTLQYYDRMDLLKPSRVTEAGYRYYSRWDLLRLQQILTLKWMGLSLEQIKDILTSPTYNLRDLLEMQKAAIDEQIERLCQASAALESALAGDLQAGELDIDTVSLIIHSLSSPSDWIHGYFNAEAQAVIAEQQTRFSAQDIVAFQEAWRKVYEAFEEVRTAPAESPPVQQLAAQMHHLIVQFTGGNQAVEDGIRRMAEDAEAGYLQPQQALYTPYSMADPELARLMQNALAFYRKQLKD